MVKCLFLDYVIWYLFLIDKFFVINELLNFVLFIGFYNFWNSLIILLSN